MQPHLAGLGQLNEDEKWSDLKICQTALTCWIKCFLLADRLLWSGRGVRIILKCLAVERQKSYAIMCLLLVKILAVNKCNLDTTPVAVCNSLSFKSPSGIVCPLGSMIHRGKRCIGKRFFNILKCVYRIHQCSNALNQCQWPMKSSLSLVLATMLTWLQKLCDTTKKENMLTLSVNLVFIKQYKYIDKGL